jgi:hypothetical protein
LKKKEIIVLELYITPNAEPDLMASMLIFVGIRIEEA